MREQSDDVITDKSNIRLPIGILVGAVITLAVAFYAKSEADRLSLVQTVSDNKQEIERRLSDMSARINTKADKADARDRYTSKDYEKDKQALEEKHRSIDHRIESLRRESQLQHESLKMVVDHIMNDVDILKKDKK
jgi:hypothetical protein